MASGAMWMALLRVSVRMLSLVSTVILARLLVPADFGLVAMATSIVAFLELATAFNFDIPLIQNRDADRRHFDTAWTLNLLFYSLLTLLLVALAGPAAAFYQESRLTDVIFVLAAGFFARGFENIGIVHFRRDMDFRRDFILMFSKKLIGFLVAIPLAFWLRSYWALVLGIVVSNVLGVAMTYAVHPFRPRFALSQAAEMLGFSKWLILNNAFSFLRVRSPDFIIGRISGSAALGLFNVAYDISTLPTTELVSPINRAVFPGYAKLANDLGLLRKSYLDVLGIVALLAFPASLGISAIADQIVALVLGERWMDAAPLIAVLALFGGVNAIQTNAGSVFNARGKPYLISVVATVNIVLLLALSLPLALAHGPMGVAVAYLCTFSLIAPVTFYFVAREIGLRAGDIIGVLWRPLLAGAGMFGILHVLGDYLATRWSAGSLGSVLVLVPAGALSYAALSVILWITAGKPESPDYRLSLVGIRKLKRILGAHTAVAK